MSARKDTKVLESERRIEANLKRVYEDSMNAPMSDQLANLVAQLRQKGSSGQGSDADE
ncbi:NepR family anti-sigma factor [Roseobacter sp. HKCCA0434]|uniref:NepR family anti-sigma factor n=1 Tax=Roseobacter sp. HKCCA0434 TaxID=3079297 RepID=UPI002905EF54|nr:NepR family anti-sigma factor [Roseobacter sp. HKCCA0434]